LQWHIVNSQWLDVKPQSDDVNPQPYGKIEADKRKRQKTKPGAVWLITDKTGKALGYFTIGDRTARGVIPEQPEN